MLRIKEWKNKLLLSVVYIAVVAVFYLFDVPCLFQKWLGIPCPGCGMTRALTAAVKLQFATAFTYHPMFWSMPLLVIYFWANGCVFGKTPDRILLWSIAAGFLVQWVVKLC